jgi:Raf kinase inhibitor-like YbhB/YbcL family protein
MRVFGVKSFVRPAEPISDRRAMRKRKSAIKTVDVDEIGGLVSAALRGWRRHAELDRASQVLSRTPTGLGFEVHVTSREAVGVRDDEARGVALLDIPRRWEAARRNGHSRAMDGEPGDVKKKLIPKGTIQSRTDFGTDGDGGPCPPQGDKPHHYIFTVYAVDEDKLQFAKDHNVSAAVVGFEPHFHSKAKASFTATYGR